MKDEKHLKNHVRLTSEEISYIKKTIKKHDPDAKIILFGSRTDLNKKGGDIDLIVISDKISSEIRRKIRTELLLTLGERKIDLIITDNPEKNIFTKVMVENGVEL